MSEVERYEYVSGSELDQAAWNHADHDERLALLDELLGTVTGARRLLDPCAGPPHPAPSRRRPARREQLERLLDSFDAIGTPAGAFTMRTDRLRSLLGL